MQSFWSTDGNFSLFLTTDSNSLQVTNYILWPFIKYSFLLSVLSVVQEAQNGLVQGGHLFFPFIEAGQALTAEGQQCWAGLRGRVLAFCSP